MGAISIRLDRQKEARDSAKAVRLASLFLTLVVLLISRPAFAVDGGRAAAKISQIDASALVDASVDDAATAAVAPAESASAEPAVSATAAPIASVSAAAVGLGDGGSDKKTDAEEAPSAEVKIHDRVVFVVRAPAG